MQKNFISETSTVLRYYFTIWRLLRIFEIINIYSLLSYRGPLIHKSDAPSFTALNICPLRITRPTGKYHYFLLLLLLIIIIILSLLCIGIVCCFFFKDINRSLDTHHGATTFSKYIIDIFEIIHYDQKRLVNVLKNTYWICSLFFSWFYFLLFLLLLFILNIYVYLYMWLLFVYFSSKKQCPSLVLKYQM